MTTTGDYLVAKEADRIWRKYVSTLQQRISEDRTGQTWAETLFLVVRSQLHGSGAVPADQQWLRAFCDFPGEDQARENVSSRLEQAVLV